MEMKSAQGQKIRELSVWHARDRFVPKRANPRPPLLGPRWAFAQDSGYRAGRPGDAACSLGNNPSGRRPSAVPIVFLKGADFALPWSS